MQEQPEYKPEKPQTSWHTSYPKTVSKNDLRGKKLSILADCPPIESNKKGIFQLKVFNMSDSTAVFVLVTSKDINHIIDNPNAFTFDATEPWAEVVPYEPKQ